MYSCYLTVGKVSQNHISQNADLFSSYCSWRYFLGARFKRAPSWLLYYMIWYDIPNPNRCTVPPSAPAATCSGVRYRPECWTWWPDCASAPTGAPGGGPCSRPPWWQTPAAASPRWSPHLLPPYAGWSMPGQMPGTEQQRKGRVRRD